MAKKLKTVCVLTAALLISLLALAACGQTVSKGGKTVSGGGSKPKGTAKAPFEVWTEADLRAVGRGAGKYAGWTSDAHYRQCADITIAQGGSAVMIGNVAEPFTGVYDGGGHTITGLTIKSASGQFVGLFGMIWEGGAVKNLGLVNASISGDTCVGGIAGGIWKGCSIANCFVTGSVSGINRVGGIVGQNSGGSVANCFSSANVTGGADPRVPGGTVGIVGPGGTIVQAAYASGDAGGVSGSISDGGSVVNCYTSGSVSGYQNVGGVVGFNNGTGTVKNCAALCPSITRLGGGNTYFGRVVGDNTGKCTGSYARSDMQFTGITQAATAGSAHGANAAAGTYKTKAFWSGTLGWAFGDSAGKPWKWNSASSLPVLWFR